MLNTVDEVVLCALFLSAAFLYSSVGHGGASAYLAVMALFTISPALMRPNALMLNILVSGIATVQFFRAGHFSWPLFWPFAAASIPLAFLGGTMRLADPQYKIIVGVALFFAAYRLFELRRSSGAVGDRTVSKHVAAGAGAAIGFISGLVGVGGGIFLSPLLLLKGWADAHRTSAVSAAFICVNSICGLAGYFLKQSLPAGFSLHDFSYWAGAVIVGGLIGSTLGSRRFNTLILRRLLALVLVIAGIKLFLK